MSSYKRSTTPNRSNKGIKYAISRASSFIFINNLNLNVRYSARVGLIEEMGSNPPKTLHQQI